MRNSIKHTANDPESALFLHWKLVFKSPIRKDVLKTLSACKSLSAN